MKASSAYDARVRIEAAGWFEGRCIDTTPYTSLLERVGFDAFAAPLLFLGEFGGLVVAQRARGPGHDEERLRFDPVAALAWIDPHWVHAIYAPGLGRALYPVGFADAGLELFLVDECGVLYCGRDHELFRYGEASGPGLEELVSGGHRVQVLRS